MDAADPGERPLHDDSGAVAHLGLLVVHPLWVAPIEAPDGGWGPEGGDRSGPPPLLMVRAVGGRVKTFTDCRISSTATPGTSRVRCQRATTRPRLSEARAC